MLGLALILVLSQQPQTVALLLNNGEGTVIVSLDSAQREYGQLLTIDPEQRTEMQRLRFAALTIALGTLPDDRRIATCESGHQPLCETQRGVRRPLQRSGQ